MKKQYAILNLISIVAIIIWNYYVNSVGINGNTVGSLSERYTNYFTPAGYAFSIWGIIFLALLALGFYVVKVTFNSDDKIANKIGPWLIIANVCNGLWLWFWLNEMTGMSVVLMLFILISLLMLMIRLQIALVPDTTAERRWVWWPISLYAGWITVATVANISAFLAKENWSVGFDEITWTVIMIVVAAFINLLVLRMRKWNVFAGVGVWAFIAIAVRHWDSIAAIQWTAAAAAVMLLANMFVLNGRDD